MQITAVPLRLDKNQDKPLGEDGCLPAPDAMST